MKPCNSCGVNRVLQVTAKVHEGTTTIGLKRLCFPCLLKSVNLIDKYDHKTFFYKEAMKCEESHD